MTGALDPRGLIAAAALGIAEAGATEVEVMRLVARLMTSAGLRSAAEIGAVAAAVPHARLVPRPCERSYRMVTGVLANMERTLLDAVR